MDRQSIRKSVRFEVLKRDAFTCQYCGAKAPDAVLQVDHINPVADGGTNDILNLVTSCRECNAGKSDRRLSDDSVVQKCRAQAEDLQSRRQQVELISRWHVGLAGIEAEAVDALAAFWLRAIGADEETSLTDNAKDDLKRLAKRCGHEIVCKAITAAAGKLLMAGETGDFVARDEAFNSIGKICGVMKAAEKDPGVERLFYIRGILRRRLSYVNEKACIVLLKDARDAGIDIDYLQELSKQVTSWTQFRTIVEADMLGDSDDATGTSCDATEATDGTNP